MMKTALFYVFYKNEELALDLKRSEKTIIKFKKELAKVGLLKEVRQGVNKSNKLYLGNVTGEVKRSKITGQELENLQVMAEAGSVHELENLQAIKTEYIKTDNIKTNMPFYEEVIRYLNEKTGSHFKASSQSTQKLLNGRLAEGYGIEAFKHVIDVKVAEWKGTDWERYLVPSTLFRASNFEKYLNQKGSQRISEAEDLTERLGF